PGSASEGSDHGSQFGSRRFVHSLRPATSPHHARCTARRASLEFIRESATSEAAAGTVTTSGTARSPRKMSTSLLPWTRPLARNREQDSWWTYCVNDEQWRLSSKIFAMPAVDWGAFPPANVQKSSYNRAGRSI